MACLPVAVVTAGHPAADGSRLPAERLLVERPLVERLPVAADGNHRVERLLPEAVVTAAPPAADGNRPVERLPEAVVTEVLPAVVGNPPAERLLAVEVMARLLVAAGSQAAVVTVLRPAADGSLPALRRPVVTGHLPADLVRRLPAASAVDSRRLPAACLRSTERTQPPRALLGRPRRRGASRGMSS